MREEPKLHLEFYQRNITDGALSPRKLPVEMVSKSLQEMVAVAQKLETAVQLVRGLGFPLTCMEDVDHDACGGLC